jgi:hypothetical protein
MRSNLYKYNIPDSQRYPTATPALTLIERLDSLTETLQGVRCLCETIAALDSAEEDDAFTVEYVEDLRYDLLRVGAFLTEEAQRELYDLRQAGVAKQYSEDPRATKDRTQDTAATTDGEN